VTSGHSDAQPWASECGLDVKNYKWQLNPVWHRLLYSCTHMATVYLCRCESCLHITCLLREWRHCVTLCSLWRRRQSPVWRRQDQVSAPLCHTRLAMTSPAEQLWSLIMLSRQQLQLKGWAICSRNVIDSPNQCLKHLFFDVALPASSDLLSVDVSVCPQLWC